MILVITTQQQLCPIVAKILEKIVATQLSNHIASSILLCPHQGGYQHGNSKEDILLVIDKKLQPVQIKGIPYVLAAFLDLKRAFDSLDHCIMLQQLSSLGLSNPIMCWSQNYFTDHHQSIIATIFGCSDL